MTKYKEWLMNHGFSCYTYITIREDCGGRIDKIKDELFVKGKVSQAKKFAIKFWTLKGQQPICSIQLLKNIGDLKHGRLDYLYHDITPKQLQEFLRNGEIRMKKRFNE